MPGPLTQRSGPDNWKEGDLRGLLSSDQCCEILSQSHTNNFHSVTRDWAHRDWSFTTDEITIPITLMCHNLQMQITLHSADL